MSLSATSTNFLNISRDSDSTTSLGSLFQCLTTLSEKFFVIPYMKTMKWVKIVAALPCASLPSSHGSSAPGGVANHHLMGSFGCISNRTFSYHLHAYLGCSQNFGLLGWLREPFCIALLQRDPTSLSASGTIPIPSTKQPRDERHPVEATGAESLPRRGGGERHQQVCAGTPQHEG